MFEITPGVFRQLKSLVRPALETYDQGFDLFRIHRLAEQKTLREVAVESRKHPQIGLV